MKKLSQRLAEQSIPASAAGSDNSRAAADNTVRRRALLLGIILLLLLLLSIGAYFLLKRNAARSEHPVAYLYSGGALLLTIDLDTVPEPYTFTVTSADGGENVIEVRPGSIGIITASCPDKLCVRQGFLSAPLFPLVCLPNELVIEIKEGSSSGLDAVAY